MVVGWFGRRIVFGRFQGMSASQILRGTALALCIIVPLLTVTFVGQADGWLPQGRLGVWVAGLALAINFLPPFILYRWRKSRRS